MSRRIAGSYSLQILRRVVPAARRQDWYAEWEGELAQARAEGHGRVFRAPTPAQRRRGRHPPGTAPRHPPTLGELRGGECPGSALRGAGPGASARIRRWSSLRPGAWYRCQHRHLQHRPRGAVPSPTVRGARPPHAAVGRRQPAWTDDLCRSTPGRVLGMDGARLVVHRHGRPVEQQRGIHAIRRAARAVDARGYGKLLRRAGGRAVPRAHVRGGRRDRYRGCRRQPPDLATVPGRRPGPHRQDGCAR